MKYEYFKKQNNESRKNSKTIGRVTNVNHAANTCTLIVNGRMTHNLPIQQIVNDIVYNGMGAITNPSILHRWSGFTAECDCCANNKPIHWKDDKNNACIDSNGEMTIMVKDKFMRFKVNYCPNCGRQF